MVWEWILILGIFLGDSSWFGGIKYGNLFAGVWSWFGLGGGSYFSVGEGSWCLSGLGGGSYFVTGVGGEGGSCFRAPGIYRDWNSALVMPWGFGFR